MKIERPGTRGVAEAYKSAAVRPAGQRSSEGGPAAVAAAGDTLSFSPKAQEAAALRARLRTSPEVRTDLVERIKARVESGTYAVPPREVAEMLLKSRVLD